MRMMPDSVEGLLADLEAHYPPRCKDPAETLEQHAHYAGQVTLIADLRLRYEWTRKNFMLDRILKEV